MLCAVDAVFNYVTVSLFSWIHSWYVAFARGNAWIARSLEGITKTNNATALSKWHESWLDIFFLFVLSSDTTIEDDVILTLRKTKRSWHQNWVVTLHSCASPKQSWDMFAAKKKCNNEAVWQKRDYTQETRKEKHCDNRNPQRNLDRNTAGETTRKLNWDKVTNK